ncbi:ABC transporter ATP-binding protein [Oceanobacillus piezotolerans]|uniref:ABC transporter ATP-binding protein n=1 Tax=Oceanobacillus piezotolerans TaxID=2448030 RepID=A0A498DK25_9BACI|nr:ABC transporter ATP-binding protein [Oceanobacillus piezotolerans]RLL46832.1 ABC transporter ATP-binding protein [Oceanobacillus piezotolerans]
MLTFKDVTVQFAGLTAVKKLSFEVPEGQIYSIIGPNGAGKTTVFNCISRFYKPVSGSITFIGEDLMKLKPHQVIKRGIARSFQNVELFREMTVLDNLLTGLHPIMKKNILSIALNLPSIKRDERIAREKANEVMEMLNIEHLAYEKVSNLSFGYQKMVDIGRAMMSDPKLILLDEPVAGMNSNETEKISQLILKLKEELNYTVLLIEHDMSLVMEISDLVTVMSFGEKIAHGVPKEVQNNPVVIEAYLGEVEEDAQFV